MICGGQDRRTQRFSRRSLRSLRAACNPRGLLASATNQHDAYDSRKDGSDDVQPMS